VGVPVGPQDVGQHDRVQRIRLRPRDPVAFPVASGRKGVDRIDVAPGGLQAGDQQPPGGLDRDRDQLTPALALETAAGVMVSEHGQQLGEPGRVVADPPLGDNGAIRGDQRDVVMVLSPVDSAGDLHRSVPLSVMVGCVAEVCGALMDSAWSTTPHQPSASVAGSARPL
jgi:hypothetical protein